MGERRSTRLRPVRAALAGCLLLIGAAVPATAVADTVLRPPVAAGTPQCSLFNQVADRCLAVQPGGGVVFPGFVCTLNFLWRGSDGARYIGTAGHCTHGSEIGAVAQNFQGEQIGRLAYKRFDFKNFDRVHHDDFALIRLDPNVAASGEVRIWGGPTGTYTGLSKEPVRLRFVGNGTGVATVAPARRAIATAVTSPFVTYFVGPATFSDSGSPVLTEDGQALGVLTGLAQLDAYPVDDVIRGNGSKGYEIGTMSATRLPRQVALAEKALGVRLTLVHAPNAVPPQR